MIVIAEIGTAHNGSFDKACKLIDESALSGADYIKFQWVYADEILHPDTGFVNLPGGNIRLYDRFKELEMPVSFFKDCIDYTHKKGKKFICSPFGLKSAKELFSLNPDAIKIASPELNHIPLLHEIAEYRKSKNVSLIISSGVSTLSDIETALNITGCDNVTLLHCVTSYPAPEGEYNLRLVKNLKSIFGVNTGVSDHSLDAVLVPSLSCAMGGTVLEKHITLSKTTDGLDDPVALDVDQFAHMTYCLRQCDAILKRYGEVDGSRQIIMQMIDLYGKEKVEAVLGDGVKKLAPAEKANYGRTNRSLHFMRAMKKGEVIKACDIGILRTEKVLTPGMAPSFYNIVEGAVLQCDVKNGEGVLFDHIVPRFLR